MKNYISKSKILPLLFICAVLAPTLSSAQDKPILVEDKMIDFDKVGTNGSDQIDPPPPPVLSAKESVITKISFYPNPCKDKLTIEFGDNAKFQKVYIYNLVGNLLYEITLESENGVINTSRLKTGIYILRTESALYRFTKI